MKTKIVIENGRTEIVLTPENSFETDAVEKMENLQIKAYVDSTYGMGCRTGHKIVLNVNENDK